MATKNLVPRGDQEGKLGLEDRRWLGINAKSGSFLDIKTDDLRNSAGNALLVSGNGITITGPSSPTEGSGAQFTISATDSGSSNAQVDRIFAGPNDQAGNPTQEQAVIAGYDSPGSALNKITFKTDGFERWFIDNDGHYIPNGANGELDIGNGTNYVRNFYVSSTSSSGEGIRFVSQNSNQISLSVLAKRLVVSSPESNIDGNTKYDNLLVRKESVKAATKEELTSYTYSNGTLTASQTGVVSIDNVTLALNDRILVKNQFNKKHNGIYVVSTLGDSSTALVLTRSSDFTDNLDFSGVFVECINGTQNSSKIFYASSGQIGSIVGTNNIIWNDFKSSGLTAIVEDLDPHLGAHLDLNNKNLFDNQSIQLLPNSVAVDQGIELSKNNLKVNFTSDTTVTIPTLSLASSASKTINIASVDEQSFFTDQNITNTKFTYTFDSASLTQTEKDNAKAFFATEGWVASQNYLTSVPAGYLTSADLSNYIQTGDRASLQTLTITGNASDATDVVGISMGSKNIRNLASPVEASDAATKQYVDNTIQSVASVLDTCSIATTEDLGATFNVSASTLTNNSNGVLPNIDSYPISSLSERDSTNPNNIIPGSRILVKDQSNKVENGIYELVSKGSAGTPWSLERTTDFASGFQASGSFIYVEFGDANKGNGFICTSDSNSDTVNTDQIKFVKFSGAGEIGAGAGLSLSGNILKVNVKPDNADQIIFIDSDNKLDANITKLVTKLNTAGGITADSAATFTWPTTLVDDVSSLDQFVIKDTSDSGTVKHATANQIKQNILSFDSTDINFTYNANNDQWSAKLKTNSVNNTHLDKLAITGQSFLLNSDPNPSEVKPSADDLILISDADDSGNLKKVKYSKFLSDITATPDFSNTSLLAENDLVLDDKVLVLDSSADNSLHHLPFSRVARKFVTLDGSSNNDISNESGNPTTLNPGYTYYYKLATGNTSASTRYVQLNSTASEHDTIEIFVLSPKSSLGEDAGVITDKKLSIKLSDSKTIEYNFSDFPKDNHLVFVYIDGLWITKPKSLSRKIANEQVLLPGTNSAYGFDTEFSYEQRRFRYKEYYIYSTSEIVNLNLPTSQTIQAHDDLMQNDSIKIYFLHKHETKTINIISSGSIFDKVTGSSGTNFLVNKKVIQFNMKSDENSDMPYIEISLRSIYHKVPNGIKYTGWFISSPYNVANSDPAFSLPAGAVNDVLKYTSSTAAVAGKIDAVNINTGAITGGVDNTGNSPTAAGTIALSTIVGANIATNTVTKDKLGKVGNYKVLGSLNNDPNAPVNNDINEVNVLKDLNTTIDSAEEHKNLATASAIKTFLGSFSGGTQPLTTISDYEVYMTNTEDTFGGGQYPQTVEIGNTNASANINVNVKFVSRPQTGLMGITIGHPNIENVSASSIEYNTTDDLVNQTRLPTPRYNPNQRPLYHISSIIRLPGAAYWHNTFGPDIPINLTISIDASDVGLSQGDQISTTQDFLDGNAFMRGRASRFNKLLLQIRPNGSDTSAYSAYQEANTSINDINLFSGTPVYVTTGGVGGTGGINHRTLFQNTQDGETLGNMSPTTARQFWWRQNNFLGLLFKNSGEVLQYKAYVRKYFNLQQRVNSNSNAFITVPEAYIWFIVA